MILDFLNPSFFAHDTADSRKANLMSAVTWANVDGFQKFKSMVVCLDLTMENDGKGHSFLLVLSDFEKLKMNQKFLLSSFFLVTRRALSDNPSTQFFNA